MKAPITFVYFDLGNILLSFDPEVACRNLAAMLERDPPTIKKSLYKSGLQDQFEHGRVTPDEFASELLGNLDIDGNPVAASDILDAISDMFLPIESMADIVARVKAKIGKVGLLSNTCHAHWDWINRQNYPPMQTAFDETILSFDVGSMKPEPEIYLAAQSKCQVDPSNILFIDDRAENVSAARSHGWNAEVCIGGPEAIAVLQRYNAI